MPVVSLAQMMESGVHFGHQTRRWNPKMSPYIYTSRNGVHIIDLVQTAQLMDDAYNYMRSAAEQGKKFLFVGTKRQAAGIVAQEAARCGSHYINQTMVRWNADKLGHDQNPCRPAKGSRTSGRNRGAGLAAKKRSFNAAAGNDKTPEISGWH